MDFPTIIIAVIGILAAQIVILFLVFAKIRRDKKQGIPLVDEMTKRITQKSGSISFMLSWVMWLVIMFSSSLFGEIELRWDIFIGLMGMGAIYIVTTLYVKKKGVE